MYGKWVSATAVVAITIIGMGAVQWDDAHRTIDLDQSPWVRAVAASQDNGSATTAGGRGPEMMWAVASNR